MADQLIELVEYDPAWPDMFIAQQGRVSTVLEGWLAGPVEHVGSTSVPGLAAKPVIDILAPVRSLDQAQAAVAPLEADGWLFWPDDPFGRYRLWFLRPQPDTRTHHLYIIAHDDPHARALLAFRDVLRADPVQRDAYARLKKELAGQHRDNRNAYTNAKGTFIEQALRGVGLEPPARDLLPE
jgi:GrpB-like predicted nucleotidyltransferase (UPF0157 family)